MTEFGDDEPEDAWHPDDAIPIQLDNLVRRAELLTRKRVRLHGDEPRQVLDALADLVLKARRKRLLGRELVRADQLDEDIDFVRRRV